MLLSYSRGLNYIFDVKGSVQLQAQDNPLIFWMIIVKIEFGIIM